MILKKLYNAINKRILTNTEKKKTDGKPNFEMATTKAATAKPLMKYEKKMIKDKLHLKIEN